MDGMDGHVNNELEFLVGLFEKHPLDSLRKISKEEGVDYYRLKRLYDRYYGKSLSVNALYNPRVIGLKSFVAFLNVPKEDLVETGYRMLNNPFVVYVNPVYGFKNGLSPILHIPYDQVDRIDEFLSKYSDDYEYYAVTSYPQREELKFGNWDLSYDYAVLMDILKIDARTPITEIARRMGRSRPTVRFMIKRLEEKGVLVGFIPNIEVDVYDRAVIGIAQFSSVRDIPNIIERFKEHEIRVGVLLDYGYIFEWFFSSKEDLGTKILEFSQFTDKIVIEYFDDTFNELNSKNGATRYSRMIKKDGSGYRSILEF